MVRRDSLLGRQIAEALPRLLVVSSHARGSCEKRGSIVVRIDRRVDPLQHFFSILLRPGFPIWSWCSPSQNSRRALISPGSDKRNSARKGDTLWVRKKPSRFSSPSTGF